ncbi:MAG: pgi [Verrucomicrobiales bacterium]|nr:pgi [Verrucomicrobiales bacterium]
MGGADIPLPPAQPAREEPQGENLWAVPMENQRQKPPGLFSINRLQGFAARCFPHAGPSLICPPGPIPTGPLPPIVVSSLMRSGTHLVIDLLLNNIPEYRQEPLYIDFDSYIYEGYSPQALLTAGSTLVKTHVAQRPFSRAYTDVLRRLGSKGLVIIPIRDLSKIRKSMNKWGYNVCEASLEEQYRSQMTFWNDNQPLLVPFAHLLDPAKAREFLNAVTQRLSLPPLPEDKPIVVAGKSRPRNLWRKLRTRLQASKAPILNTTVGFRL